MNLCKIKGCLKPVAIFQNGYCAKHGREMAWMEKNEVKDAEEEDE